MNASRLTSTDPALGDTIWEGQASDRESVAQAIARARDAGVDWARTPLDERIAHVRDFAAALVREAEELARLISRETGKPLWEGRQEVASMAAKVEVSIAAQAERAGTRTSAAPFGRAVLRHRPHGVMAVLGPYNFPGHLPNGHIVPALLAGDVVVFKPSEETPGVGQAMHDLWIRTGLPSGVIQLVHGGRPVGAALVEGDVDGLLFTGSARTGTHLRRAMVDRPSVVLALELGGNNPLIAWDGDPTAIASIVVQSAFATTGQRCSCARRLIVPDGPAGARIVEAVAGLAGRLRIGAWSDQLEPALGPLISARAAAAARAAAEGLEALGARVVKPLGEVHGRNDAFVNPAIYDVTGTNAPDDEIFAPVLQVIRVANFDAAVHVANATAFGLAGGLVSRDAELWRRYAERARVGVLNWNRPTTGAAAAMPFGGVGASGNHRPSAFYAADYCAYPVASFESDEVNDLTGEIRGLTPVPG